uniref:Major capsid protein L1 n=1 Tax=Human papillomavirus TaxID=10566 RepID=A0A385PSD3_9PAPI|nr:MAG: L1 protein [Human papillomavirus]
MICIHLLYQGNENDQMIFNVLQMALWLQTRGTLYLPPSKPVATVMNTDDYVVPTNLYFHGGTDRMLIVGHPYYDVTDAIDEKKLLVPKCSGNQFRVIRLLFPDPNKFAIADPNIFNPEKERLVWRLEGIEIGRGGPLGIGLTGNPLFNKYADVENPTQVPAKQDDNTDYRVDVAMDPKQIQLFIVGCTPPTGEHWDVAARCPDDNAEAGSCPPIQLVTSVIQDGDMVDIGFGNCNFKTLQQDRSGTPLEITNEICKWPDFLKMSKDAYGDQMFFCGKKEQMYSRHMLARAGIDGDHLPDDIYYPPVTNNNNLGPYTYFPTTSGSLVTSDNQLFNKPYWLHNAQGANNGICWENQLFVTVVDNSRGTNFNISVYAEDQGKIPDQYKYKSKDFKNYSRHTEEYELEVILQLYKVPLNAETLSHLNVMNPDILENWDLSFVPPPPEGIQDSYRYLLSKATKCPSDAAETVKKDPWGKYAFWTVDMTERLSAELSQFSLGKKFLYQTGMLRKKRVRTDVNTVRKSAKRKRSK